MHTFTIQCNLNTNTSLTPTMRLETVHDPFQTEFGESSQSLHLKDGKSASMGLHMLAMHVTSVDPVISMSFLPKKPVVETTTEPEIDAWGVLVLGVGAMRNTRDRSLFQCPA